MPDSSSVRIRQSLHSDLKVVAADLSDKRGMKVTITELLEEGIEGLLIISLDDWVQWAKAGVDPVSVGEPSVSFRIRADLSTQLGVLAARITKESKIAITKTHLLEVASRKILAQAKQDIAEMDEFLGELGSRR